MLRASQNAQQSPNDPCGGKSRLGLQALMDYRRHHQSSVIFATCFLAWRLHSAKRLFGPDKLIKSITQGRQHPSGPVSS